MELFTKEVAIINLSAGSECKLSNCTDLMEICGVMGNNFILGKFNAKFIQFYRSIDNLILSFLHSIATSQQEIALTPQISADFIAFLELFDKFSDSVTYQIQA